MNDSVEFYEGKKQSPFLTVNSSFHPNEGDLVNIQKVTWEVVGRSFSVDYADDGTRRKMRCNVIVKRHHTTGEPRK